MRRRLRVVALSATDYREAVSFAVDRGVTGPTFYDGLHVMAARKARADRIATLNTRHFAQLWPASQLIEP